MHVYLAIYSALAIAALGSYRRRSTYFFVLAGFFLVWFMGFRYRTGCDYGGYLRRWLRFDVEPNFLELAKVEEAGFALLTGAARASGLDYTWFNVVISAILVICYIRFARFHAFSPVILTLLFPIIVVQLGMSGVRQALAGGFLMLAFNSFARGEKIWTATWVIIGAQFHASVAMFLPIALLAGSQVGTIRLGASLLILGPLAAIMLGDRVDTYAARYGAGEVESGGALIRYALAVFPLPFFIIYRRRVREAFPDVFPLLKLSALLIISLAPLTVLSTIALHRVNFYILPLSILLCVYVGAVVFRRPSEGLLLVALVHGSYQLFWFLFSSHARICYVPYQNTWFM